MNTDEHGWESIAKTILKEILKWGNIMGKGSGKGIVIDLNVVEQNALKGGSNSDIAEIVGVTEKFLVRHCRRLLRRARALRRVNLHHAQYAVAMKGNSTLLTFLGKHELGQGDGQNSAEEPEKSYVGIEVERV